MIVTLYTRTFDEYLKYTTQLELEVLSEATPQVNQQWIIWLK